MIGRRDFLKSLLAAGAVAGLGREALAAAKPVPLGILLDPDTPEGRGAQLGLEESQRLGELLHLAFVASPTSTSTYALIGLHAPKVEPAALYLAVAPPGSAPEPVWPHVYYVASSAALRRQALDRHKDRTDLKVIDWHPGLQKFGAEALKLRFLRRFKQPMDEASWRGWMAVKVATELALRNPGTRATDKIADLAIDGNKGMPLRFDPQDHHLIQPVCVVDPQGKVVDEVNPEWKE